MMPYTKFRNLGVVANRERGDGKQSAANNGRGEYMRRVHPLPVCQICCSENGSLMGAFIRAGLEAGHDGGTGGQVQRHGELRQNTVRMSAWGQSTYSGKAARSQGDAALRGAVCAGVRHQARQRATVGLGHVRERLRSHPDAPHSDWVRSRMQLSRPGSNALLPQRHKHGSSLEPEELGKAACERKTPPLRGPRLLGSSLARNMSQWPLLSAWCCTIWAMNLSQAGLSHVQERVLGVGGDDRDAVRADLAGELAGAGRQGAPGQAVPVSYGTPAGTLRPHAARIPDIGCESDYVAVTHFADL